MIHSEDRDDIRAGLQLISGSQSGLTDSAKAQVLDDEEVAERTMIARFRCLLDNTCGFIVSFL
jgi:hypothetical protein